MTEFAGMLNLPVHLLVSMTADRQLRTARNLLALQPGTTTFSLFVC